MKHERTRAAFPLSPMQQGMLFHSLAAPHSGVDLQQVSLSLPEIVEVSQLQRAWHRVAERHEILRGSFEWHGKGGPTQQIQPEISVPFRCEHWRGMPQEEQPSALDAWLAADRLRELDLTRAPLWRIALFEFAEAEWHLVWTVHHLLLDARGIFIVLRDVFAFYEAFQRGEELTLPPLPSFCEHLEHLQHSENRAKAEAFWRERLKGYTVPATLSRGTPLEDKASCARASQEMELSKKTTAALNAFAVAHELTLNTLVQAAWALLVARYSGTNDVAFGAVRSGRRTSIPNADAVAGLFISTVPVRAKVTPQTRLLTWLTELRETWVDLRPFEHTALTDIQTWSDLPAGVSLFDSLVNFQPESLDSRFASQGSEWQRRRVRIFGQPNYPVALDVSGGEVLHLEIVYDARRFEAALVTQMLDYLRTLFDAIPARPDATLADLPLLTQAEEESLTRWNATEIPYPRDRCIHELFAGQAARTPDAVAIADEFNQATYAELNQRAHDIAGRLLSLGFGPGLRVGVWMERSIEMVAAQLGVLKAGGAYLPLDPAAPVGRINYMLGDAQAKVLLTLRTLAAANQIEVPGLRVICLDESLGSVPPFTTARPPESHDPAYVIYTSGSTGTPKGIEIEHASLVNLVTWHQRTYGVNPKDRATLLANPSFDASVWELWPYLTAGASVHVPNEETVHQPSKLASWLKVNKISLAFVPTPLAEALFDEDWKEACALRAVLTGGDKLNRPPPESFPCPLYNHYGPTEGTVVATSALISPATNAAPPIGRPISNTKIFVLDERGQPVPVGVPGELHIAGDGLARGYVNRPELTAEKFSEAKRGVAQRLYRTGDFARWLPSGELEFLGRRDRQVKIRGHRIELGEIEFLLTQHLLVREAAVLCVPDGSSFRLCAFIVPQPDASVTADALREFLRQKFSDYMVPTEFSFLETLPLTANGKRDYAALVKSCPRKTPQPAFAAPASAIEQRLTAIWSEVLEVEGVGTHDDFFALGGHSLRAARVVSRVEDAFQCEFPIREFFEAPTVALMAQRLEAILSSKKKVRMVIPQQIPEDNPDSDAAREPLSFAQERLWFLEQLQPGVPFNNIPFAFRLEGRVDVAALEKALNEIVRRHDIFQRAFLGDGGQPVAQWQSPVPLQVSVLDLSELPESERESKAKLICKEEAKKLFDLGKSPLLRATLLRLADDRHWLLLTTHHLVCDGWSMAVVRRELGDVYHAFAEKQPLPVPAPAINYRDFTRRQRQHFTDETIEKELVFWKRQLADAPTALDLPTDRGRPAVQTYRGATHEISLSSRVTGEVIKLSRRQNVTPFMVLLAAFQTVLHRYSGQSDLLVGTPTAGRSRVDTENLVGLVLNTVVLRGDLSGDPTFEELLRRTRQVALDAFAHQELPFEKLAEAIHPERDLSRPPLFQVMFVLQNGPQPPLELSGLKVVEEPVHSGTAKFDLTLSLEENASGIRGVVEYNTDLFDQASIQRFAGHFETLLAGAVARPNLPITELPLLTRGEIGQLSEWNRTQTQYPREKCIHELFLEQVARTPDAVAVCCGDAELSYQALNERADGLAERLRLLGVKPESRVAICIERSLEMMIGLLGILKAGGCYVPLDPNYPAERLAFLLQDSKAAVLLTREWLQERFQFSVPGCEVIGIESLLDDRPANVSAAKPPARTPRADDLAYVIYTSGSTGKPKGVTVTHRNVVNFFTGMDCVLGTKPGVWLAVTSISFDISVLELFWTLTRGYKVVLQEEEGHKPLRPHPVSRATRNMDFSLFYFASEASNARNDQYRLLIEGAKFADQNGFSAVWTPERHFHPFGGIFPNPSVVSAAVAMITQRIQIRAGSIVLPLHHPVRVAEEWSVVDNLSNGRAAISIASGWHANDFAIAPENYSKRKAIMLQNVELIHRLWRGEEVSLLGKDGAPASVRMFPRPIQPELPMWLTSSGNPETFQLAGDLGFNLLTHLSGQDVDSLAAKIGKYRTARKKDGRSRDDGRVSLMLHTFVGKDAAKVRELVRQPLFDYLRTYRDLTDSAHGLPPALQNHNARNGELNHLLEEATDRYLEHCGLFGTPESCLATVEKLRAVGVDEIACLIDFGIAADSVLESLNLLSELRERVNRSPSLARGSNASPTDGRWRTVADNIVHHGVTHLQCTPSLAGALALVPESLEAMRQLGKLLLGGEALPLDLARRLRAELPAELFNLYGPTETTVWSAAQRIESVDSFVAIGRPIANTQIHIVDAKRQRVPIGVRGEMYIGGDGVALGYLNQPELTTERFVADPFAAAPGRRMYRTGDLARWRADGTIEFLGRFDQQVKLRGHRIELGEIESVLREHAAVTDCAITLVDPAGNPSLVACVVASSADGVSAADLRRFLETKVPDYMIPAHFVTMDKLPLTPNGKLDRNALPLQTGRLAEGQTDFVAPQSPTEQTLARIWSDLLHVDRVGVNDNLFDLGGHSLLVVQAQARLRAELGVSVPVVRLFQYPTVSRLATFLGKGENDSRLQRVRARGRSQRTAFSRRNQSEVLA
ncbi:MAG TPA: amino acid adenylation domain-containing protein [Verrucomicrobiae bacterium]|nr:amino acid adenylation domain-containing protein [Verrucomicrobiae bacterium]